MALSPNTNSSPPSNSNSRPSSVTKPPSYLKDHHCSSISSVTYSTYHPLSNALNYEKLTPNHWTFVHSISSHVKPTTYSQVVVIPKWQEAMPAKL